MRRFAQCFHRSTWIGFVLVSLVVGLVMLVVRAAAFAQAVELEAAHISGNAATVNNAQASGGRMVVFGQPPSPAPNLTPSSAPVTAAPAAGVRNLNAKGFGLAAPELLGYSAAQAANAELDIASLGVQWVRVDFSWPAVQPDNATSYDWSFYDAFVAQANAHGLQVLALVGRTPAWARSSACAAMADCPPASSAAYATFVKALTQHYGSQIGGIEVWNEANTVRFWASGASISQYTALLKSAYTAVKSADPSMLVLTSGTAPACTCDGNIAPLDWVQGLYANGAQGYFDAIAHHPYSHPALPTDVQNWSGWSLMTDVTPSIRSIMIANGDGGKMIWATEVGAPTGGSGKAVTCANPTPYDSSYDHLDECLQGRDYSLYVSLARQYAAWMGPMFFYTYRDTSFDTSSSENFYGLVRADGVHKPAYDILKALLKP